MFRFLLASLLALTGTRFADGDSCGRVVCYHTNWSQYRPGSGKFFPENIDPTLCTHMVYSFARLTGNHLAPFEWNDDSTEWSTGLFQKFQDLKQRNPYVKTLLAVGGWNMGSEEFTHIAQSPINRQDFIKHSTAFLRQRGFDGLDLDWEYPANRGSPPEDRAFFTVLVRELREEFEREAAASGNPPLLLTAAVAAGKDTVDTAYDIPAISQNLDFINLMTYDLHGSWESVTGHNSPLFARSDETGDDRYLNMHFAAQYWAQKGAPRDKLVIGMALFGRSFTLASPSNSSVGAPAPRGGLAGTYTGEAGFLSYYEICDMEKAGGQITMIDEQRVPYIHYLDEWVGFDNPESLREKVRYVKQNHFGGVMVWALPLDDFSGSHCGQGPYPLMHAIDDECARSSPTIPIPSTPQPTQPTPSSGGTQPPSTRHPHIHDDLLDCQLYPDGFYPSHRSCHEYFICTDGSTFAILCPGVLVYNANTTLCDDPNNYQCTLGTTPPTTSETTTTPPQTPDSGTDLTGFCGQKTDGLYALPRDCKHFVVCISGTARRFSCAPGTVFDPINTTCASPVHVPSCRDPDSRPDVVQNVTDSPTTAAVFDVDTFCSNVNDGMYTHPEDCTQIVECFHDSGYLSACPDGKAFNAATITCDSPENVPACDHTVTT